MSGSWHSQLLTEYHFHIGEAILNVFEAASKKKSWDHFTKAQRRNITQWHQLIKDVSRNCVHPLFAVDPYPSQNCLSSQVISSASQVFQIMATVFTRV